MITLERWQTFSKRDQLAHIASEIMRASLASNENDCKAVLERAIDLIDLSLSDSKWRDDSLMILYLRDRLANVYIGKSRDLKEILAAI